MKKMICKELRKAWIDFFKSKDHLHLPSASLLPADDPTLLFTSAGMVPFKDYFNGTKKPPHPRIVTIQKCLRTTDLESVGKTARHCTFFEMLGNFSFGDYFKKEAIEWAYEFSLKVLELDSERIYVTIYKDDDEAFEIWNKQIGIPEHKIIRLGKEHNWWGPAGDSGPCGPCTELYLDRGEQICFGETGCKNPKTCKPGNDCDRYLEYWNLVFNQYFQDTEGKLHPLPKKGIDTGAGLERIVALLNETDSVYETDELNHIQQAFRKEIQQRLNKTLDNNYNTISALRVLTDHLRSVTFAISDGIFPENTGRGYVIRRIIRRALLFAHHLGIHEPILYKIHPVVVDIYKEFYPEVEQNKTIVQETILQEENRFLETLTKGIKKWNEFLEEHKNQNLTLFDGEKAFILYDTYGFPLELTIELAQKEGLNVDIETFNKKMEEQKEKSKQNQQWKDFQFPPDFPYINEETKFTGYETYKEKGKILSIIYNNQLIKELNSSIKDQNIVIVTDKTCFYPEGGGQVGDTGYITGKKGKIRVLDTKKKGEIILHIGTIIEGSLQEGEEVELEIDKERRKFLTYHHSSTHLLNKALRDVLGDHIYQTGSLVAPDYLRFDFSHNKKLSEKELEEVEKRVIEAINAKAKVEAKIMALEEAKKTGAIATFGEKYGDVVRIIEMGEKGKYSIEFCGGCHVKNTGDIKYFHIIKESSPGAGNRRIEAVANERTIDYFYERIKQLENSINEFKEKYKKENEEIQKLLQTIKLELPSTKEAIQKQLEKNPFETIQLEKEIQKIENQITEVEKQIKKLQKKEGFNKEKIDSILKNTIQNLIDYKTFKVFTIIEENLTMNDLKVLTDKIKEQFSDAVILCGIKNLDKCMLLYTCTNKAVEQGIDCSTLLKETIPIIEGKGGGKKEMAQGGGKPDKIKEAIEKANEILKTQFAVI
ncbi:MAG: alanine--tRNA ligase [Leptospiraceae bacterium]|nr:MAG: alanine--tRNA ligase [Leptospiraceae bacterium]